MFNSLRDYGTVHPLVRESRFNHAYDQIVGFYTEAYFNVFPSHKFVYAKSLHPDVRALFVQAHREVKRFKRRLRKLREYINPRIEV